MKHSVERFDTALRKALLTDSRSFRAIGREADVPHQSLQKYARNKYDLTLRVASSLASVIMPSWNSTTEFFYGTEATEYMSHMVQAAQKEIKVIGNGQFSFGELEAAVARDVGYQRVLTGEYVSGALGEHLKSTTQSPHCKVYQTSVQHYQPMAITDDSVFLLLPISDSLFGGLHLSSDEFQSNFSGYFQSVLNDDRTKRVMSCQL